MPTDFTVLPADKQFRQRRGTTAAIQGYAGALGELVVDTTKNTLVLTSGTAGTNYPLARESRTVTAGQGVAIEVGGSAAASATLASDFTLKVNMNALVAANDLLQVDASGKLAHAFSLSYDATTGTFSVLGSDGTTVLSTVNVPSSVSMLQSATLEVATPAAPISGQTSGTFLHFVFQLSNGSTSDVYANVTDLIDVYTAGAGLALNNGEFSVVAGGGIKVDGNGVGVSLLLGENILKIDNNGNLYTDMSSIQQAIAGITVVSADTGNVVRAGTDGGALVTLAATGNALTVDDNGALIVPLDGGVISAS